MPHLVRIEPLGCYYYYYFEEWKRNTRAVQIFFFIVHYFLLLCSAFFLLFCLYLNHSLFLTNFLYHSHVFSTITQRHTKISHAHRTGDQEDKEASLNTAFSPLCYKWFVCLCFCTTKARQTAFFCNATRSTCSGCHAGWLPSPPGAICFSLSRP